MADGHARRDNNFDFIRFAAAILVWWGHCYDLVHLPDPLSRYIPESAGSLGVAIFFILSGYFVTQSYAAHRGLLPFVRNRALRILPALIAVVLLCIFVLGPLVTSLPFSDYFARAQTWNYLRSILIFPLQYDLPGVFTGNPMRAVNGSLWTLQHEVRCYALVGLLGVAGVLRPRMMVAFFIAFYAIRIYGAHLEVPPDRMLAVRWGKLNLIVTLMGLFAGGGVLCLARERFPLRKEGFALAFLLLVAGAQLKSNYAPILFEIGLTYAVIYVGFLKLPLLPRFGRHGDFSYGIYLWAFPMQQLALQLLGYKEFGRYMAASLAATLVCAFLSWRLIEKPALALKA